jgi:hypothetical protein
MKKIIFIIWLLIFYSLYSKTLIPVSSLMADRKIKGIPGKIDFQLDEETCCLKKVILSGNEYITGSDFPLFTVLDNKEGRLKIKSDDKRWKIEFEKYGREKSVIYSANGLKVKITYIPGDYQLNILAEVIGEGNWRLISIEGTFLKKEVDRESKDDYIVDGSGWIVFPHISKPVSKNWISNSDNLIGGSTTAGFVALKERDRIVYLKPLTLSYFLGWNAVPEDKKTVFSLSGGLLFRPSQTKIFETKLCHNKLAMRLETIGDINKDNEVDWVDAGIGYRERYIKTNPDKNPIIKNSFRVYFQVKEMKNYKEIFDGLKDIDYASGIWWLKGIMKSAVEIDSESHPYKVQIDEKFGTRDELLWFKNFMKKAGHYTGIYYGHDYITFTEEDNWPDEFIKKDPNNYPYKYYKTYNVQKYYKDNVRAVATGKIFEHYKRIIDVCLLKPQDVVMLDTFSAFAREGYNPDFPATPELETEAKRKVALFFHKNGILIAGEGIVEGLQDVVDYGAYAIEPRKIINDRMWEEKDGILLVPMLPVVFGGASYYGAGWYEFRNPNPKWAIGLVYDVGYWDWLPQGSKAAWTRFARYYFNQNIFWAQIADAKVLDIDKDGPKFTVKYDNGCVLKADIEKDNFSLEKGKIVYDGFTPFNDRGYMAVLKQDEFEIKIPGKHYLEISPNQPYRDKIEFKFIHNSDNTTTLKGKFGHLKWKVGIIQKTQEGKEIVVNIDADPVLVLRKIK